MSDINIPEISSIHDNSIRSLQVLILQLKQALKKIEQELQNLDDTKADA